VLRLGGAEPSLVATRLASEHRSRASASDAGMTPDIRRDGNRAALSGNMNLWSALF
jgi:hypothetical protein